MKKLAMTALFAVLALAARADSLIGIFADEEGDRCWATLTPFVETRLHVLVFLDDHDMEGGLTAAEFALEGWPRNSGYPMGAITEHWNSDLVLGTVYDDFSIAFSEPQAGPVVELGSLSVQLFSPDWIGNDHAVIVVEGSDCDCLVVVDDLFELHEARGLQFTFNCTGSCSCLPGVVQGASSWSAVKSMF